jgi:hypothetical protein
VAILLNEKGFGARNGQGRALVRVSLDRVVLEKQFFVKSD